MDMDVTKGEVVVILGPSGSGKSTLLRCVNLLEEPTGGKIFFEDIEVTGPKTDVRKVRERVGMVFQSFNLFPHLTAKGNVMLAQRRVLKRSKAEAEKTAIEQLTRVGLADRIDYLPGAALGWPAAAGGYRPGACHGPSRDAVRRGDLGPGPRARTWACSM